MAPVALFSAAPWLILAAVTIACLLVDLRLFARDRDPTWREGVAWSIGWLVLSLVAAVVLAAVSGGGDAITYTTVYFIERSLSLDNLFVFLILFTYFGVPSHLRANLIFWGILFALVTRGVAILGGVELIHRFDVVLYVLGAGLIVLAVRVARGVEENVDPARNVMVRLVRRVFPVTPGYERHHWFVAVAGRRHVTPLFLCLAAIVAADIAFAIDSIPAAFAITRDPVLIWMANVFALLGMRALFVLVEGLVRRLRYLDEMIAVVLGLVGVKLLLDDIVHVGELASLAAVAGCFAIGTLASLAGDRRAAAR